MTVSYADKQKPDEPLGFVDSNQDLLVTVTVKLTGRILNYLCGTQLCVCLAWDACGYGSKGEKTVWLILDGEYSPCKTNTFKFVFDLAPGTFSPGECGREYRLCITLGSKDCCGKVGFVYGKCEDITITVEPPQTDGPLQTDGP